MTSQAEIRRLSKRREVYAAALAQSVQDGYDAISPLLESVVDDLTSDIEEAHKG